jgi:hypothetical protein
MAVNVTIFWDETLHNSTEMSRSYFRMPVKCFPFLPYSFFLIMESTTPSETSVSIFQTTRHMQEDSFHGNESLGFERSGEFTDQLSDCHILSKNSAFWNLFKIVSSAAMN